MYVDCYNDVNTKQPYHETQFQPTYTPETYLEALTNSSSYIVLVNQSPHLYVDRADYVMLRRNMRDAFLSQANFFIVSRPYLKGEGILQHLYLSFQSLYGVLLYLNKYPRPIVWYEDYYGIEGTKTDALDQHPHKRIILHHIDKMMSMNNTQELLRQVRSG
jgi:hypothetical protein